MNDESENLKWNHPFTVAQLIAVILLLRRDKRLSMDVLAELLRASGPQYDDMVTAELAVALIQKSFATLVAPAILVFVEPKPGSQQEEAIEYFLKVSAAGTALKAQLAASAQASALNN